MVQVQKVPIVLIEESDKKSDKIGLHKKVNTILRKTQLKKQFSLGFIFIF